MNYDDWKLSTPPDTGEGINDELIQCCCCERMVSPYAMRNVLICNNCFENSKINEKNRDKK